MQDRNLQAGGLMSRENAAYWLTSLDLLSLLSVGGAVSYQLSIKKNVPQACPQANLLGVLSRMRFPHSQKTLVYIKLT